MMQKIPFYKMHGSGNDVLLVEKQKCAIAKEDRATFVREICHRQKGVGADGLIFLDFQDRNLKHAYSWDFYNSDGSSANMCGNGSRCAAWLAVHLKKAPEKHSFLAQIGLVQAQVYPKENEVNVRLSTSLPSLHETSLIVDDKRLTVYLINTGVPHAVIMVDDINGIDVYALGHFLRSHPIVGPEGANVDFVQLIDSQHWKIRTYERGVEAETLACGTGCAAAGVLLLSLNKGKSPLHLLTQGGDVLKVSAEKDQLWLRGPVCLTAQGTFLYQSSKL